MVRSQFNQWRGVCPIAGLVSTVMVMSAVPIQAQTPSDCPPPDRGEYLLLAPTASAESQALVRSKAPSDATIAVCRYFGETVTRIGGFNTESAASVWGQYLIRTTGIKVTIAAPLTAAAAAPTASISPTILPTTTPAIASTPAPLTARSTPSPYSPKVLGTGYAVLVNYNNRPETASQLGKATNAKVGVVSYGERPYLLANQTNDQAAANAIMQLLSDRGFLAMVVDARRVVLLKAQTP